MGVAIDRLSSLPREILVSMILSLLHTKECVRTCVLSKRWEHLWREVPAIKLEFIDPDCYYVGRPTDPLFSRLYGVNEDNVDFLLAGRRQSSSIMRLELSCPEFHPAISLKAKAWIDYCVERKVQELMIDLGDNDSLSWLTSSVLSHCPTLKCLQFTAAKIVDSFNINDYSCLRNLRDLRLSEVKYFSGDSLERLVSNCPKLKRLRLYGKFDALNILSSSLERLELAAKRFSEVSISCPNLEFFSFENRMYKRYNGEMYFRGDMPSLVEAEMYIPSATKLVNPFMAQVLKSIKHVEVLNLEFDFEEEDHSSNLLDAARNFLPTFHELESLCLVSCFHSLCMKVLILFLKCSPNLKFLQLEHVDDELKNCACGSERCDDRKLVDSLSDLLAPLEEAKVVHKDESETYKNGFLSSFSNYVFVQE